MAVLSTSPSPSSAINKPPILFHAVAVTATVADAQPWPPSPLHHRSSPSPTLPNLPPLISYTQTPQPSSPMLCAQQDDVPSLLNLCPAGPSVVDVLSAAALLHLQTQPATPKPSHPARCTARNQTSRPLCCAASSLPLLPCPRRSSQSAAVKLPSPSCSLEMKKKM